MKKHDFMKCIVFLKPYILKYWINFLLFYIGWLGISVLGLYIPILFGRMIDVLVNGMDINLFYKIGIEIAALYLISWSCYMMIYRQHNILITRFAADIKIDIFDKYKKMEYKAFLYQKHGELLNKILWYPAESVHFLVRGVIHQVNRIIRICIICIIVFRLDFVFGICFVVLIVCSVVVLELSKKKTEEAAEMVKEKSEGYANWLWANLKRLRDVIVLATDDFVKERLDFKSRELFREKTKFNVITTFYGELLNSVNTCLQIILYVVLFILVVDRNVSVGTVLVVVNYYNSCIKHIAEFMMNWQDAKSRIPYMNSLIEFMQIPNENLGEGKKRLLVNRNVQVQNLSFDYDEKKVLHNVNLKLKFGLIGIKGRSGCGKSTLINILATLLKADTGNILFDEDNIDNYSLNELRDSISLLSQDSYIIEGTIRDNLTFFSETKDDRELLDALKKAGLDEMIQREDILDVVIGRNGVMLSGGEMQRLNLARLYIRNSKIILLDEPTSKLDPETERRVMERIKELCENRIGILVSHRSDTLQYCDKIYSMKEGELYEA